MRDFPKEPNSSNIKKWWRIETKSSNDFCLYSNDVPVLQHLSSTWEDQENQLGGSILPGGRHVLIPVNVPSRKFACFPGSQLNANIFAGLARSWSRGKSFHKNPIHRWRRLDPEDL